MAKLGTSTGRVNWRRLGRQPTRSPLAQEGGLLGLLVSHRLALAALVFLLGMIASSLLAPWISPFDPFEQHVQNRLLAPSWFGGVSPYVLGTDGLGRDLLSRLLSGGKWSMLVAAAGVAMGMALGTILGLMAGFGGGMADTIIMRLVDLSISFSSTLLILILIVLIGPGPKTLILVFGLVTWVLYARVVRAQVLSLREAVFIQAAYVIGCSRTRIMVRHLLPQVLRVVVAIGVLEVARLMVMESGLSFIGYGVQPPDISWGLVLASGRDYIDVAWWLTTLPGLFITLAVLSLALLHMELRRAE